MITDPTTPADEVKAIARIAAILSKLDPRAQDRIASWVAERYPEDRTEADA